jgi:hypothetical protein
MTQTTDTTTNQTGKAPFTLRPKRCRKCGEWLPVPRHAAKEYHDACWVEFNRERDRDRKWDIRQRMKKKRQARDDRRRQTGKEPTP